MTDSAVSAAARAFRSAPTPENAMRWATLALRRTDEPEPDQKLILPPPPGLTSAETVGKSATVLRFGGSCALIHYNAVLAASFPGGRSCRTEVHHSRTSEKFIRALTPNVVLPLPQDEMQRLLRLAVPE